MFKIIILSKFKRNKQHMTVDISISVLPLEWHVYQALLLSTLLIFYLNKPQATQDSREPLLGR